MKIIKFLKERFIVKVILFFIIIFVIPLLFLSSWLRNTSKKLAIDEAGEYLYSNIKIVGDNFDELLRNVSFIHTQLLSDAEFIDLNSMLKVTSERTQVDDLVTQNRILERLSRYYLTSNYLYSLNLYNSKGDTLFHYSLDNPNNKIQNNPDQNIISNLFYLPFDKLSREWHIMESISKDDPEFREYQFSSTSHLNQYNINAKPLYFNVNVNFLLLQNRFIDIFSGNTTLLFLKDNTTGKVIPINTGFIPESLIYHMEMNDKNPDQQQRYLEFTYQSSSYIFACYTTSYSNFDYIALAPTYDIIRTPLVIETYGSALIITLVVMLVIIILFTSHYILSPIKLLFGTFKKIEEGDLSIRLEINGNDELGYISHNFNAMLDSLNNLITENYENVLLKKEAELKFIQSQINEHFLYNTLDSIHWLAEKSDYKEISKVIFSLSGFFRLSLSQGQDIIPVSDVIQIFNNYIYLINTRLDDPLTFTYRTDEGLSDVLVLKYIFQPLLENVVLHGFHHNSINGKIDISFTYHNTDRIRFIVTDNGCGISAKRLVLIQNSLLGIERPAEQDSFFALRNVNRQLHLYYGEEYSIHIESEEFKGTTVYFDIPLYHWGFGNGF